MPESDTSTRTLPFKKLLDTTISPSAGVYLIALSMRLKKS